MTTSVADEKSTRTKKGAAREVAVPEPDTDGAKPDAESTADSTTIRSKAAALFARIGVTGVLLLVMVIAVGVLGWRLHSTSTDAADRARAEQIALDYATGAAQLDFRDPEPWRKRLTNGTSPELADRLNKAAASMNQLIVPMQWTTTARPLAAKVVSHDDGVFQVAAFVGLLTKNSQRPDGIDSTATYRMTIDPNRGWQIVDISEAASPAADAPK